MPERCTSEPLEPRRRPEPLQPTPATPDGPRAPTAPHSRTRSRRGGRSQLAQTSVPPPSGPRGRTPGNQSREGQHRFRFSSHACSAALAADRPPRTPMASRADESVNGGESEQDEAAGRRQIATNGGGPSDSGGGDDTCRLLALPAGLLPLVAGRLNLKDRLSLRACCRATRAGVQLWSLRVRRAALLHTPLLAAPSLRVRPTLTPPPLPPMLFHHACAAACQPQIDGGNAAEVCAAALGGRLAAAFPALWKLAIEPQALLAMARQHASEQLTLALAGCGALEALEVCEEGGALLAQLVARLQRLRILDVRACESDFFEVRKPPSSPDRSRRIQRRRPAPLTCRRRCSPPPRTTPGLSFQSSELWSRTDAAVPAQPGVLGRGFQRRPPGPGCPPAALGAHAAVPGPLSRL